MSITAFNLFLGVMSLIALIVFIALYFVKAGYGIFALPPGESPFPTSWRGY